MEDYRSQCTALFTEVQDAFCAAIEKEDGKERFTTEKWQRPDLQGQHGGGGVTKVLRNGAVFEQGGVNFSEVTGTLPAEMTERLIGEKKEERFYATGTSLVIHPYSPMVPTTHANVRYLEVGPYRWFGGGMDLTPYVLFEEDAQYFHQEIKSVCDRHAPHYYPSFKKWCDEYFFLPHRGETRGVGGIFFDYLGKDDSASLPAVCAFVTDLAKALPQFYAPIVARRKTLPFSDAQKRFQLIRRGRYVEFNLLYDRGTLFGLKTSGRTESILMSLPPEVRWEYNYTPEVGSAEHQLTEIFRSPRTWVK